MDTCEDLKQHQRNSPCSATSHTLDPTECRPSCGVCLLQPSPIKTPTTSSRNNLERLDSKNHLHSQFHDILKRVKLRGLSTPTRSNQASNHIVSQQSGASGYQKHSTFPKASTLGSVWYPEFGGLQANQTQLFRDVSKAIL